MFFLLLRFYLFFFFSSRRRHTRYWRDWSSDVCSSDLKAKDVAVYIRPMVLWSVVRSRFDRREPFATGATAPGRAAMGCGARAVIGCSQGPTRSSAQERRFHGGPDMQVREADGSSGGQPVERAAADQAVTSTATPSGASSSATSQLPSWPSAEASQARICRSKARSGAAAAELTGPRKVRSTSSPPSRSEERRV